MLEYFRKNPVRRQPKLGLLQRIKHSNYVLPYFRDVAFWRAFIVVALMVPLLIAVTLGWSYQSCHASDLLMHDKSVSLIAQANRIDSVIPQQIDAMLDSFDRYDQDLSCFRSELFDFRWLLLPAYAVWLIIPMFIAARLPRLRMRRNMLGGVRQYFRYWHAHMWLIRPLQSLMINREIKLEPVLVKAIGKYEPGRTISAGQSAPGGSKINLKLRNSGSRIPVKIYRRQH